MIFLLCSCGDKRVSSRMVCLQSYCIAIGHKFVTSMCLVVFGLHFLEFFVKKIIVTIWCMWEKNVIEKYDHEKRRNFSTKNCNPDKANLKYVSAYDVTRSEIEGRRWLTVETRIGKEEKYLLWDEYYYTALREWVGLH